MTEAEWLACGDPRKLLRQLGRTASKRKRRLFGCASCRHIWDLIPDQRSRAAVEVAERFADGLAGAADLDRAKAAARAVCSAQTGPPWAGKLAAGACLCGVFQNAGDAQKAWQSAVRAAQAQGVAQGGEYEEVRSAWERETPLHAALLRDIFGNPFRPVVRNAAWLTSTVASLAEAIYAERAFDRMPILGDALEEAGCTDAEVLTHCRQPGVHAKGCWVVDLILGKE